MSYSCFFNFLLMNFPPIFGACGKENGSLSPTLKGELYKGQRAKVNIHSSVKASRYSWRPGSFSDRLKDLEVENTESSETFLRFLRLKSRFTHHHFSHALKLQGKNMFSPFILNRYPMLLRVIWVCKNSILDPRGTSQSCLLLARWCCLLL